MDMNKNDSFFKIKLFHETLTRCHFKGCALCRSHFIGHMCHQICVIFRRVIDCYSLWGVNDCNFFLTLECIDYFSEIGILNVVCSQQISEGRSLRNETPQLSAIHYCKNHTWKGLFCNNDQMTWHDLTCYIATHQIQ